ncbi:MAG: hypothetical protein ACOH1V_12255 [Stenotrophomonas sp.]
MVLYRFSVLFTGAAVSMMLAFPVLAQRVMQGELQQQMSASEFKTAGLDKLNPDELAALNRWLQGKVEQASASAMEQAREEGRQEVIVKNRGFLDFGSSEPIEAHIVGEFKGLGKGRQFTLDNGQQWEQTEATSLSGIGKQSPKVKITPGVLGAWYLQVDGYNTRAKVRRIK